MWESLNNGSFEKNDFNDDFDAVLKNNNTNYIDDDNDKIPRGFGRSQAGSNRADSGRGGGRGRGRGRGLVSKEADWECPSCTNVNWSWRTNCNMCSTLKPRPVTAEVESKFISDLSPYVNS